MFSTCWFVRIGAFSSSQVIINNHIMNTFNFVVVMATILVIITCVVTPLRVALMLDIAVGTLGLLLYEEYGERRK